MDGLSPARRLRRDEGNVAKLEGPANGAFLFGRRRCYGRNGRNGRNFGLLKF